LRDAYIGAGNFQIQDRIYVSNSNGTLFYVKFIERVGKATSFDHKRVYLDRRTPNWPTKEL